MKMWRFKFSREIRAADDRGAVESVRAYVRQYTMEQHRQAVAAAELDQMHQDILSTMKRQYKVPAGLTLIIDPTHLTEHDVLYLSSKEVEEFDAPDGETCQ